MVKPALTASIVKQARSQSYEEPILRNWWYMRSPFLYEAQLLYTIVDCK